jgi:hypothetical protein
MGFYPGKPALKLDSYIGLVIAYDSYLYLLLLPKVLALCFDVVSNI